jgi:protein-L-isoaspartate O-methyltransferase
MNFYDDRVLPYLVNFAMRQSTFAPYRERVLSRAKGTVLEIGAGSGLNFRYYTTEATEVVALDRSRKLLTMAHRRTGEAPSSIPFAAGFGRGGSAARHER